MSRTNRWRRAFSFGRALAKRSSSAVAPVFTSVRASRAGLGFLRESDFFFALRREGFDFGTLKGPLRSLKIVEVDREAQSESRSETCGTWPVPFVQRQCYS